MATVKALKNLYTPESIIEKGSEVEMEQSKAEFHEKRGNVEIVVTKELKIETKK